MYIEDLRKKVCSLVAANQFDKALELIKDKDWLFEHSKSTDVLLLTGRLNALNSDTRMGLKDTKDINLERNNIAAGILGLVDVDKADYKINKSPLSNPPVSFKDIKEVFKGLKDSNGRISYLEAIEVLGDLF